MAFYLESEGHTKTVVNGEVVDDRSYEAVSNSKGTNLVIKQDGNKFLLQDNPLLNVPANPKSLILRLNSDFLSKKHRTTKRRGSKSKKKKKRHTKRH
jgi:hypothetical protein